MTRTGDPPAGPSTRSSWRYAEALANAVRHGTKNDPSKPIACTVACDMSRGSLIIMRDGGPGFDPSRVPSCPVAENLYSHHGRGIYLNNQLMDEVRFERGGTEIHMIERTGATRRTSPSQARPPRSAVPRCPLHTAEDVLDRMSGWLTPHATSRV